MPNLEDMVQIKRIQITAFIFIIDYHYFYYQLHAEIVFYMRWVR